MTKHSSLFLVVCFAAFSSSATAVDGKYYGELLLKPLPDGRNMEVRSDFGYEDPEGTKWPVPKGVKVDGASIPWGLWSLVGGPFEGLYRDASVIHDYYCEVKTRTWKATHRVFYDAMITSGETQIKAKSFYYAVNRFGPRWEIEKAHGILFGRWIFRVTKPVFENSEWERVRGEIEHQNLDLDAIEKLADQNRQGTDETICEDLKRASGLMREKPDFTTSRCNDFK